MNKNTSPDGKSDTHALNIGEVLRKAGSVTQPEIDAAVVVAAERGLKLGEALVAIGACTADAVARALEQQARMRRGNSEAVRAYLDVVADAAAATSLVARGLRCG